MTSFPRMNLREITRIEELGTLEVLMRLLAENSSQQLIYSNYANQFRHGTDREALGELAESAALWIFSCALVQQYCACAAEGARWFLRDWSGIADEGARAETFVACHLLKAVEGWSDLGLGEFELRYIRTTAKGEVDFVIVRNRKPWILVEVKKDYKSLSPQLYEFQKTIKTEFAFQVAMDLPFVQVDCFSTQTPVIVPARTFLSQLL